jgi:hypothetical protein
MKQTNRELIQNLLEDHPEYRQRKFRYQVVSRLTDVDPETCKLICSLADEFRHLTEVDEVGEAKAEEWKRSPALAQSEQDWVKVFRRTATP